MSERKSQEERREATRGSLVLAGRRLFGELGYSGASQEGIVSEAGVTRGALYHHFKGGKLGLFRAVVIEVQEEIEREISAAARELYRSEGDFLEAYLASFAAYLDACLRPDVRRILMQDGASVLGWEDWHGIDSEYGLSQTEKGLRKLIEVGILNPQPVEPLAHLMYGASLEAATYVLESEDPEAAKAEMVGLVRLMLVGFMVDGGEK
ncbi:TetR/AcrR family transcriptional regulator [Rubrobacter indicoceani]|uniref:TetR/AcrR family transcriptional regulator n=1 Tax=Rubrobacter indicoceani TaxID=2051957 RepID=UPI0013C4AD4E|nr:TetR/AcrR family transcriptional regulator [Rubrobacter indicoceani]